ncbi:MAG: DHHA1 domain-containing protein [Candidatus Micrarchaeota archaeon]|nr:DHHA1 domain-containing protein [Candidatus Micrarchaeota archaeon]
MSNTLISLKKKFSAFLAKNKNKKFVICPHSKADIDAISSAYGLASAFKNSVIALPDDLNESAKTLVKYLGIRYELLSDLDKSKFDGMIVADTSAYTLIKPAKDWNVVTIIDHHKANGRDMSAPTEIFDEMSPSCAEIVANIIPKINDEKIAFALACGIVADTARFKNGREKTFETLAKLIKTSKSTYLEILDYSEPELTVDAKVAVMRAFKRMTYTVVANYVIATSETGSNESDTAAHLSNIVDVAFVASYKEMEGECRMSARGRKTISVPLNEVCKTVAVSLGGNGGGHAKAAGLSVPKGDPGIVLKRCVEEFIGRIR